MNEAVGTAPASQEDQQKITALDANILLAAEFEYIAQSAFQANEDRARVSTYYVVTFATLVAALFTLQLENVDLENLHRALVVVFLTLTFFGVSVLLQIVRLRQAWTECAAAMNQIKTHYTERLPSISLGDALQWRASTMPARYKPWSIAFLLASQVALLSAVSFGASIYFLGLITGNWSWTPAILSALFYFLFQLWLYRRLLIR